MTKKIGEYEVVGTLGAGGMATVYKGRQASLDRIVAIKVLSHRLKESPELVERFNREALIIARLTHPNIIHIIDRGTTDDGMFYFVMDYIEGTDFSHIIKAGKYGAKEKVDVIVQVCKALSYAHKNGVIHRDIKPANILIDSEGNAMVSDFGIAQFFSDNENEEGEPLTSAGAVMGTMAYMSPEQKSDSGKVDAASDIYSLGVVMYEMYTGVKPLGRFKTLTEINPRFPKPLERIILQCLESDPRDRLASADELKDRLLGLLQGAHIKKSQKEQAFQGIKKMEELFSLLDIIKTHKYGAVYLFERKKDKQMMVIKKSKDQEKGLTESRILSKLSHKNIVRIFGVSGDQKLFIIVMEYLSGGNLKERMVKTHTWQEVMKMGRDICRGLSYAHKNKVLHGNLRPSNILLDGSAVIKIADFGLEEHYHLSRDERNWYQPPGEEPSPSGDVYSVGVILYEMLTGSLPNWKENKLVPNDRFRLLPVKVQMGIMKMIQRDKGKRPKGMDMALSMLEELTTRKRKKKRSLLPILLLLAAAAVGAAYFYRDRLEPFIAKFLGE